jgi:biopolymer transport protein ExbB/TolQ
MTIRTIFAVLIISFFSFTNLNGQSAQLQEVLDSASVEEQFNYIVDKSSRYEQYKVIRETWLNQYRKSLNDTVNELRRRISDSRETITERNQEIQSLNTRLQNTEEDLKTAIKEKNSLLFLGIKMDKTLYNLIMWVLVAILTTGIILLFLMYKRSHTITRESVKKAEKLQNEYDEYRNNSRLKIEKLKREHLDEILKLKGGK